MTPPGSRYLALPAARCVRPDCGRVFVPAPLGADRGLCDVCRATARAIADARRDALRSPYSWRRDVRPR